MDFFHVNLNYRLVLGLYNKKKIGKLSTFSICWLNKNQFIKARSKKRYTNWKEKTDSY